MRTTHLLPLALVLLAPTAAADALLLFEDASGDAGPLAAWGMPVPGLANGHADLLHATLLPGPEDALLVLTLAALPPELPPDTVWFAGWSLTEGTYVGVGYARVVTPETPAGEEGATYCVFDRRPEEGGRPDCTPIEGAREGEAFALRVPLEALGDGRLREPGGAVVRVPDATAWPLFVAHFTGLTVEDYAQGEDVDVARPAPPDADLAPQSAAEPTRAVPLPAALLAALAALAAAARRRQAP